MRSNKVLIYVVLFEKCLNYFDDYISSLDNSNYKNFDLLVVLDNLDKNIVKNKISHFNNSKIIIKQNISPAKIRLEIFKYAINNNYNYIICSDVDDKFSSNRLKLNVEMLQKYDFVYNKIVPISQSGEKIKSRFSCNYKSNFNNIISKNFIGLGALSLRCKCLKDFHFNNDPPVFDWYLAIFLILKKYKGFYENKCAVYYRQHDFNFNSNLVHNKNSFTRLIKLRVSFYKYLKSSSLTKAMNLNQIKCFEKQYFKSLNFKKNIIINKALLNRTLNVYNNYLTNKKNCWFDIKIL